MFAVKKLKNIQEKNKSMICLGLDLDPKRMPHDCTTSSRAMFDFVQQVVDATKDQVCAYKPNLAFYENLGADGMSLLRLIVERIPEDIPVILDGKRGDISNTANHYAASLFDTLGADWVTVNPYMGYDSMRPFIERKDRGSFILCLTSNAGSRDFQELNVDGKPLYMVVAEKVAYWNKDDNCGLVVGATHPEQLAKIRSVAGDMPLLIPGVGAQGGALERAVIDGTANFTKPAVINVCRSVLYASNGKDFATKARSELMKLNQAVNACRQVGSSVSDERKEEPKIAQPTPSAPPIQPVQTSPQPPEPQQSQPNQTEPQQQSQPPQSQPNQTEPQHQSQPPQSQPNQTEPQQQSQPQQSQPNQTEPQQQSQPQQSQPNHQAQSNPPNQDKQQ